MIASVSPDADQELTEGAKFYSRGGGEQVAAAFIDEFERVATLLCAQPQLGIRWGNARRRFPLRKFPYSVIYYLRDDELRIVAIAHHRRRPGYWSGRR